MYRKRIDSLQALRTFAFLGIFTSHTGLSDLGEWGVSVFFVLSGFLMAYQYEDRYFDSSMKENFGFAVRKIQKLYPLHILTMAAVAVPFMRMIFDSYGDVPWWKCILFTITDVFLIQSWFPTNGFYFWLNGVAWFLSDCLFIYFVFPWIHRWIRKQSFRSAIIYAFVIWCVQIGLGMWSESSLVPGFLKMLSNDFSMWFTYIFPAYRLGDFVIGALVGVVFLKAKEVNGKSVRLWYTLAEVVSIILFVASHQLYVWMIRYDVYDGLRYTAIYTLSSVVLVLVFAMKRGYVVKCLANPATIFVGGYTAYAFLLHKIIITWYGEVLSVISLDVNLVISSVICFLGTIAVSILWERLQRNRLPMTGN